MNHVMPIGGFFGPLRNEDIPYEGALKDLIIDKVYTMIKDLGINFISYIERDYTTEPEQILDNLYLAEKYGIGIFVRDKGITNDMSEEQLRQRTAKYSKYKSFLGITVCDEPGTVKYCMNSPHMSEFSKIATTINSTEDMAGYINLFPKYGSCYEDLDAAFESYVEEYIHTCAPKFLSYDYYPFLDAQTNKTCVEYFQHLTYFSAKARKYDLPLWPHVEVGGHFWVAAETVEQTIPTRGQMLWNVNHCLAFGAKAIQYFPLMQPVFYGTISEKELDFDRNGLVAANGEPTKWYNHVKDANRWIARIQHILMNATHEGVLAKGDYATKVANIKESRDNSILKNIKITNEEFGAIVGKFDYDGKRIYYVVNYDYDNAQQVTLQLENQQTMKIYNQSGTEFEKDTEECQISLEAGQAAIVIIE